MNAAVALAEAATTAGTNILNIGLGLAVLMILVLIGVRWGALGLLLFLGLFILGLAAYAILKHQQ